jgi:hypothetical protein
MIEFRIFRVIRLLDFCFSAKILDVFTTPQKWHVRLPKRGINCDTLGGFMFITTRGNRKCSACGAVNFFEIVCRNQETVIRCIKCWHEKTISVTTVYPEPNDYTVAEYTSEDSEKPELF